MNAAAAGVIVVGVDGSAASRRALRFALAEARLCAERLVFPAFGVDMPLPVGRVVRVQLLPTRPGEYPFGCGFRVLRGRLIVR